MNSLGYWVEFKKKKAKIYDANGELIGSGDQTRGILFYLDLLEDTCLFAKFEEIWLWHKRLCHVNFDNLVRIVKMKKVRGFPRLRKHDKMMCKQCQMGKMKNSSFKRKTYSLDDILEFVQTNLCAPIRVHSYYGDKYFILFVDDYSKMMIVMFLKEKIDAFNCLSGIWQELKRK